MGRRKQGAFDDAVEVVALMPWWVGIVAGVLAYLLFHMFAAPPVVTAGNTANIIPRTVFAGFANALQYIVPAACGIGALVSFLRRRKRGKLLANAAAANGAGALNGISWHEFELLVGEAFRLRGYSVLEMGGHGADGGVDLVVGKSGNTFLVQCKQWKAALVDVKVVRELYGVITHRGVTGGFVITSGRFTKEARDFARGKWLHLIDGEELYDLIQKAQEARKVAGAPAPAPAGRPATVAPKPDVPGCPECGSPMILRTAQKGANAGRRFWGCSKFPGCRGTRGA